MQQHGLPSSWLWSHKYHLAARWSDKFAVGTTTVPLNGVDNEKKKKVERECH